MLKLDSIESALKDLKLGKMIVLVDDEDRENEGDLVIAAEHASAELINFMLSHGKGLICVTMSEQRLEKFNFPFQVQHNTSPFGTNFAVSFDLKSKEKIGNSASARAEAIKHLTNENAKASDFILPGHVFPLGAVKGGVLKRRGQTEGSHDLCKLAGLEPVGVICEIMDCVGNMLSGEELQNYCTTNELKIISVEQIVNFRIKNELSVRRIKELKIDQDSKLFVYVDDSNLKQHYALVIGEGREEVRIFNQDVVQDIFHELLPESSQIEANFTGSRIEGAIDDLKKLGGGILVYLRGTNPNLSEHILSDLS